MEIKDMKVLIYDKSRQINILQNEINDLNKLIAENENKGTERRNNDSNN